MEQSAEVDIAGPNKAAVDRRADDSGPVTTETETSTDTESELAQVLAAVIRVDHVPVGKHFFDDLGANSLVMAQFCARLRKRPDLPSASMKDIYRHPTIRSLAAALAVTTPASTGCSLPNSPPSPVTTSQLKYVLCGIFQLLMFLGYSFAAGTMVARGYEWIAAGSGTADIYLRSLVFGGVGFVALCVFPVVAKWILIGRWKPCEFPVWSLTYLRFWLVKVLLHANPLLLFVGNPLYPLYLRALGARIGKGVTILSHSLPVCTDLLTIGAGTVIRKDSFLLCYRAHAGRIQTGPVTLGRDVFIGEKTVLDIDTRMGDGAQLGHSSALYRGQAVPDGEHWHGSPAQPTEVDYVRVPPMRCGTLRRATFGLMTLLQLLFLYMPLALGGTYMLFTEVPAISRQLGQDARGLASGQLMSDALVLSLVLFFGFVVVGLVALYTVPRLLNLVIQPDKVYPLYGFHYSVHRAVARMTNIKFFTWLFGDSSYIVYYLKGLGYDLSRVEQTGSNFGTEVQHESPYLVSVGRGTMVADGLSIVNAEYSSTSFRISRASIGSHNFLGNNIAYPVGARTGDNCLLATKVMVPLDGEVRQGVGLLGSPCFEIPRSVERDARFDDLRTGERLRRQLAAKNRYNLRSMALMLCVRWLHTFALTMLALVSVYVYGALGHVVIAAYLAMTLCFSTLYYILLERCIASFRALRPRLCSIYDPYFWWHERLWKVPDEHLNIYNGTPFKSLIWRMLGVRIGSRVFDDGCYLTERTLTTIGDACTLNAGSKIQCHSQEDGTFKSDGSTLGAGCTLGVSAHVHYGVTMGDGAVLAPDSFLMKGEEVPPNAWWGGNPAADMPDAPDHQSHAEPRKAIRWERA
ncbi:Pls/PosA family non-ribosomal peptide synthetase [Streptomyces sp. Z423-1]|uniref:Pls/PosA family non-ribosomal peptide synthetase n=1 Tax=unclassified Streptomyces TaxID=2593676 RepID=UPI0014889DCF|nr:Pls/PosA family non-ribosomal peptide synthetase [Streptomyces sp. Z423-1]